MQLIINYLLHPTHSFRIEAQRVLASLAVALLEFSLLEMVTEVSSWWDTVTPVMLSEIGTGTFSSSGKAWPQLFFALVELD